MLLPVQLLRLISSHLLLANFFLEVSKAIYSNRLCSGLLVRQADLAGSFQLSTSASLVIPRMVANLRLFSAGELYNAFTHVETELTLLTFTPMKAAICIIKAEPHIQDKCWDHGSVLQKELLSGESGSTCRPAAEPEWNRAEPRHGNAPPTDSG
jgi:hypothetical protein